MKACLYFFLRKRKYERGLPLTLDLSLNRKGEIFGSTATEACLGETHCKKEIPQGRSTLGWAAVKSSWLTEAQGHDLFWFEKVKAKTSANKIFQNMDKLNTHTQPSDTLDPKELYFFGLVSHLIIGVLVCTD